MRTRDVLRLVGATSLAVVAALSISSPANAWVGLSDKQKAHIEEYIHCKILLLTDIKQFEAEQPPCGGTPSGDLKSIAATGSGSSDHDRRCEQYPSILIEGEYCPKPE